MDSRRENSDRIEIYLDAVAGFITDIDLQEQTALRDELRSHLLALAAKYRTSCVFEEDAVEMALQKFGPAYRVGPALNKMTQASRCRRLQHTYYVKRRWTRLLTKSALVLGFVSLYLMLKHDLFLAAFLFAPICGIAVGLAEYFDEGKPPVVVNARFWRLFGLNVGFLCIAWLLEIRFASPMVKHWMTPLLYVSLLSSLGRDLAIARQLSSVRH